MSEEKKLREAWREGRDYAVRQFEALIMAGYSFADEDFGKECRHGVRRGCADCYGCYDEALLAGLRIIRKAEMTDTLVSMVAAAPPHPARRGRDMSAWMPIETAPKDGTWIIGYHPSAAPWSKIGKVRTVRWGKQCWLGGNGTFFASDDLTHWQPLPQPPEET